MLVVFVRTGLGTTTLQVAYLLSVRLEVARQLGERALQAVHRSQEVAQLNSLSLDGPDQRRQAGLQLGTLVRFLEKSILQDQGVGAGKTQTTWSSRRHLRPSWGRTAIKGGTLIAWSIIGICLGGAESLVERDSIAFDGLASLPRMIRGRIETRWWRTSLTRSSTTTRNIR
jgi:hypothetical protein